MRQARLSSATPERFEDGRPMLLAGLRRRHEFEAAESGVAEQWREFLRGDAISARVDSNFYGVMCGSDGSGFEYMCGVEVHAFETLAPGTGRMRVPAQHYAVFSNRTGAMLRSTWQEILAWLSSGPYESAHRPDFERYSNPPSSNSDLVEVWVGVVPRGANGGPGA
jgi:predicted transcriptional regulator YdeE